MHYEKYTQLQLLRKGLCRLVLPEQQSSCSREALRLVFSRLLLSCWLLFSSFSFLQSAPSFFLTGSWRSLLEFLFLLLSDSSRERQMLFSFFLDSPLSSSSSLVKASHWALRLRLNLSRKSLSTMDCSSSFLVRSSSCLNRSVSLSMLLTFSSLISKNWLVLSSTMRCFSSPFSFSSLRTVSSSCSVRERLISPEDLVQSEVWVSVRKVSLDLSWCRRFLTSLEREDLLPAGLRNSSRISFLRCSLIFINYQRGGGGGGRWEGVFWGWGGGFYNQIQMSTTKTITLSMESLNRLYFQFFDRYVTPNLLKTVNEITQLLRNRTAYDVYKYLEELISRAEAQAFSPSAVSALSPPPTLGSNLYQYALPTTGEGKGAHSEHLKGYEKGEKVEDSISFKNKLGVRRTMTGLAYDQPKTKEYRNYEDIAQNPSIYTNPSPPLSADFKLDFGKDPLPLPVPVLARGESEQGDRGRAMKQIVRKLGKIFNQNHSKIEKYNRNTESNKLFNINTSTRLDKKQDLQRVKSYQFHGKAEARKY